MRFGQLQIVTSALEPDEQRPRVDMLGMCLDASKRYHCKGEVATVKQVFVIPTYSDVQLRLSHTKSF